MTTCVHCGGAMEAGKPNKRYCGARCRKQAQRDRDRGGALRPPKPLSLVSSLPITVTAEDDGSLRAAVARELRASGQQDSSAGRAALILAERIESGNEPGGAVATMVGELRGTLAAATRTKGRSRLQELREHRASNG